MHYTRGGVHQVLLYGSALWQQPPDAEAELLKFRTSGSIRASAYEIPQQLRAEYSSRLRRDKPQRVLHGPKHLGRHMGIDKGRLKRFMPKELLNQTQVRAMFQ